MAKTKEKLTEKIQKKATDIVVAVATNQGLQQAVRDLAGDVARLEGRLDVAFEDNALLKNEIVVLKEKEVAQDNKIATQDNKIATQDNKIATQESKISAQDKKIA